MQVSICDLEWYNGDHTMPNIKCMQLSSYHQQLGDTVTLLTQKSHFSYIYDILYVCREKEDTEIPAFIPIKGNDKVHLIGSGFRYYDKYDALSPLLASMRPDYLLYSDIEGKYSNANFVQYFWGNQLIKSRQDYHNTLNNKKFTVVVDKNFWKQTIEDIQYCLVDLQKEKNVSFLYPISLKVLIENEGLRELFFRLSFTTGTDFRWRNDYSSLDVEPIIKFLLALKNYTSSNLGYVPIMARTDTEEQYDIFRCFKVINLFKYHKLQCRIIPTSEQQDWVLQELCSWTEHCYKLSYIEFVLRNSVLQLGLSIDTILNNSRYWKSKRIDELLGLLCWEELREKGFLLSQWGGKKYNDIDIDYNYIQNNTNLLYRRKYE